MNIEIKSKLKRFFFCFGLEVFGILNDKKNFNEFVIEMYEVVLCKKCKKE